MKRIILVLLAIMAVSSTAVANYVYRDGAGNLQTIFTFVCGNSPSGLTWLCPAQVLIDSSGAEKAIAINPLSVRQTQDSLSVPINISTVTTQQLVPASGSESIYVTSWDIVSGAIGNFQLVYGTGSNCGTGTTPLTGPYPLSAQAGLAKGSGVGAILTVPSGKALCASTSAAVQMSGSISYQQF